MATLPTNYVDDQLADSMGGRRHYNMTTDAYGTYLTDVTEYTQRGSTFAAAQINETNAQVNENTNAITNKLGKTDDTKNNTTTFTSADTSTSPSSFQTISLMTSGEKHSSLFEKLSQAIKNIRWLNNNKRTTGAYDTYRDTVTFSSGDSTSATSWTDVSTLSSGLTHATLLNRISTMMKNVRYLYSNLSVGSNTGMSNIFQTYTTSGSFYLGAASIVIYGKLKILSVNAYASATSNLGDWELGVLKTEYAPNSSIQSQSRRVGALMNSSGTYAGMISIEGNTNRLYASAYNLGGVSGTTIMYGTIIYI